MEFHQISALTLVGFTTGGEFHPAPKQIYHIATLIITPLNKKSIATGYLKTTLLRLKFYLVFNNKIGYTTFKNNYPHTHTTEPKIKVGAFKSTDLVVTFGISL